MAPDYLLRAAHGGMAVCGTVSLLVVYVLYGAPQSLVLPLPATVAGHIALIVFPAVFKLGYVVRLAALKQMGRAVN
ncbi:hypothetical protein [Gilvimarinus polysaccharolyticus]|uniref:hypothetical protein n=1 Tax=Gilvimarinus polysaccharolyticus TaxID=863921 RepID=UPI000673C092|nr:hypothetical protein [Gilvimarinus polysaccharolyticus]